MKVLIIGASGVVGYGIYTFLSETGKYDIQLTCRDVHAPLDALLFNYPVDHIEDLMKRVGEVDVVINCAAYTNVDQLEVEKDQYYQENSLRCNILFPFFLGKYCKESNIRLIHISTLYTDYPAFSIYARSKQQGDELLRQINPSAIIVKLANVYGEEPRPNPKNFIMRVIDVIKAKHGPEIHFHDAELEVYPTYSYHVGKYIEKILLGSYSLLNHRVRGTKMTKLQWAVKTMQCFFPDRQKTIRLTEYSRTTHPVLNRPESATFISDFNEGIADLRRRLEFDD
jgi:dTDP-4-dehydrorhamnose reductase